MAKEKQENQQKQTTPENEKAPKKDIKKEASDKKDDQTSKLKEEIADLKKQLADKDDKYLRAEAEIQNMTNRFNKERAQILKYDGQDLAKSILPVLDNLKRALAIEVVDDNGKQLKKGIQMVHDHLVKALNDHGITEIKADGETFDPTLPRQFKLFRSKKVRSLKLLLMFFKQDINSKTGYYAQQWLL